MLRSQLLLNNFGRPFLSGESIYNFPRLRIAKAVHGIRWFQNPPTPAVINAVREIAATERDWETRWIQKNLPPRRRLYENKQLRMLITEDVAKRVKEEQKTGKLGIAFERNYRKAYHELVDMLNVDATKPYPSWTEEERRLFARILEASGPFYFRIYNGYDLVLYLLVGLSLVSFVCMVSWALYFLQRIGDVFHPASPEPIKRPDTWKSYLPFGSEVVLFTELSSLPKQVSPIKADRVPILLSKAVKELSVHHHDRQGYLERICNPWAGPLAHHSEPHVGGLITI